MPDRRYHTSATHAAEPLCHRTLSGAVPLNRYEKSDNVNLRYQNTATGGTKSPILSGSGGIIGRAKEYTCLTGSTIIGRKGTINNPVFVEENFWNVDTAFGMKATWAIEDKHFFYFCLGFDFSKLDKSTALPSLTKTAIGNIVLPIPPYEEQRRIVNAIDKAFSILDSITENL